MNYIQWISTRKKNNFAQAKEILEDLVFVH